MEYYNFLGYIRDKTHYKKNKNTSFYSIFIFIKKISFLSNFHFSPKIVLFSGAKRGFKFLNRGGLFWGTIQLLWKFLLVVQKKKKKEKPHCAVVATLKMDVPKEQITALLDNNLFSSAQLLVTSSFISFFFFFFFLYQLYIIKINRI